VARGVVLAVPSGKLAFVCNGCDMTDLKQRPAAVLASARGQAMIQEGQQFSIEELQAAFAQVLEEADGNQREVIKAAMNALMARKAN
jgi:hypothetical protein